MEKEFFSPRQAICTLTLFIMGSSLIMGGGCVAKQDSWMCLLLSMVICVPFFLIYGRIMRLYPEKDLFEILNIVFGKIGGKCVTALITWYAIHLGALVLRNFSEFIEIVVMPETPQLVIMITMILLIIYVAKSGIATFGKWSVLALPLVISVVLLTIILSIKNIHFDNLLPIMESNLGIVGLGAYQLLTFPLLETVLFLCLADSVRKQDNPYKIYIFSLILSGIILLIATVRNIGILGPTMITSEFFPSYTSARIISVGEFLSRIEGSISMNFILAGTTKITLCIMAASKGIASLFETQNENHIILPVGLLSLSLCAIVYNSTMEMFSFLRFYKFYAIPFQMIIPIAVWITAEIKVHKKKKPNDFICQTQNNP